MSSKQLHTMEDWKRILELSHEKPVLVFKHSTSCSVSAGAIEEWTRWHEGTKGEGVETALVRVIEERPVSNAIAEELEVKHASPQAILIRDGKAEWNASHWNITETALSENAR
ncbi:bacillithiol system redox-active protein YtxJ [Paenibacillus sp. D51F]